MLKVLGACLGWLLNVLGEIVLQILMIPLFILFVIGAYFLIGLLVHVPFGYQVGLAILLSLVLIPIYMVMKSVLSKL